MIEPREHQRRGIEIARRCPTFAFFWDPGTGKTYLILFIHRERPVKTCVVAQKSILPTAWQKSADELGIPITVLRNTRRRKISPMKRSEMIAEWAKAGDDHVIAMNHELFKKHWQELLDAGCKRVVFDESSKIKNRDSNITKTAIRFSDKMDEVYILSGTPAPNCPTELWSQMRCLSTTIVGRTFFGWANRWFVPIRIPGRGGKKVIKEWVFKHGREEDFYESLRPLCWYLAKSECVDLPPKTCETIMVDLSEEEADLYDAVLHDFCMAIGDENGLETVSVRAEGQQMKLRQIAGGSVIADGRARRIGTSKMDALIELLEELGGDTPVLIWAEFVEEIQWIVEEVNKMPSRNANGVAGGFRTEAGEVVEDFVAGKINTIVAHPRSMGHGTDQCQDVCSVAIYYSLSYSAEEHSQSQDRIHRSGQNDPCTYFYLIAENTIDESLLRVVEGKATKQDALLTEFKRFQRRKA